MDLPQTQEAVKELSKSRGVTIAKFLTVLGALMIIPLFHNQFLAGPLVNALLFVTTIILGLRYALLLSVVPSAMALMYGLLPALMAPFVPFIMVSNMIMVLLFKKFSAKYFFLGVALAAAVKFLFLFITHQAFFRLALSKPITQTITLMMSWNQLYTALLGGLIAYVFLKFIKRI